MENPLREPTPADVVRGADFCYHLLGNAQHTVLDNTKPSLNPQTALDWVLHREAHAPSVSRRYVGDNHCATNTSGPNLKSRCAAILGVYAHRFHLLHL